ncbi:MAG: ABC transporter ATP-binding protein [Spirochaetales bacterium]|nr:ABC transporter ATP-binding protein [Spirochaetales bacterium]
MSKLVVKSLTRRFGGLVAVDNLDFELGNGEIVGIIGPNGAGKTTLINLISGICMPTSGSILFDDKDITLTPAHIRSRMGIGRTFQLIHPLENLSLIENIMTGFLFSQGENKKKARLRAEDLCALMNLTDTGREISQLNILEMKKMEIAHALATGPSILFLDEVMAGLNSDETKEIIKIAKKIASSHNMAIGVVEHVMGVIKELTERVIVLDSGKLIAKGVYEEVSKDPKVITAYLGGAA